VTVTPWRGPVFNDADLGFGILYILEDLVAAPLADGRPICRLDSW